MSTLLALALISPAQAGEFMDIWVTTAVEDTNINAGPADYSPSPNFVMRGNRTFFDDYESRYSDDISQSHLVLYRKDEGYAKGWSTEAAMVLQFRPYLDPDQSTDGVDLKDDGSYVRVIRELAGENHTISLTGYAIDASRFRLGYSYDLSYGGKEIMARPVGAMPGARLQWQKGKTYAFGGIKTAIGPMSDIAWKGTRNQSYRSLLAGAGTQIGENFLVEAGAGAFQQGQLENVPDSTSILYGRMINAFGVSTQLGWRSTTELDFIQSGELRLYQNSPDQMRDSYIRHANVKDFGVLIQAEVNYLGHDLLNADANLLDADDSSDTILETAMAADIQTRLAFAGTVVDLDLVYKDLPYILFNIPGLTSGVSLPEGMETTPQLYGRLKVSHYFSDWNMAPSLGFGLMQPASYKTSDGTFVQYSERDKEGVPSKNDGATNIMAVVLGNQLDLSKSMTAVGELLYTIDQNLSKVSENAAGELVRVAESKPVQNAIGFNLMLRARF
jgi:hypothetical protein